MTANKSAWVFFSALAALLGAGANTAEAQCYAGSPFCAQVQVQVGIPAPPVVYVQPAPPPPVVYVQPAPPPPVVYVQPAPPPQQVYVQQAPPPRRVYVQPTTVYEVSPRTEQTVGLHGSVGVMATRDVAMAGAELALRLRPNPFVGIDLSVGAYGGQDYNGNARVEVPFTGNVLFFFNPQNPLQLYGLVGAGVSYASVENTDLSLLPASTFFNAREFTYFGGQLGLGLEWRLNPYLAINFDVRGFLRTRIDDQTSNPEFVELNDAGNPTGRTSNTSAGVYSNFGLSIYF